MANFEGFDELEAQLQHLAATAEAAAETAPERIDTDTEETAQDIVSTAQALAPVKSGDLRNSIRYIKIGPNHYVIGSDEDHAAPTEYGTGPYPIEGDPLHFYADGEEVFVEKVEHPGVPAQPFLRPALKRHQDTIIRRMRHSVNQIVAEALDNQ